MHLTMAERLAEAEYERWRKENHFRALDIAPWESQLTDFHAERTETAQNWLAALRSLADDPESGVRLITARWEPPDLWVTPSISLSGPGDYFVFRAEKEAPDADR